MFNTIRKHINNYPSISAGLVLIFIGASLGLINLLSPIDVRPAAANPAPAVERNELKINKTAPVDKLVSGTPSKIEIPSTGIALEVAPGYYNSAMQTWSLSLNYAHYATVTAPANNKDGQTFIYAHNRKGVFQNLPSVKAGDTAIVTTTNGHVFTYKFSESKTTIPTDTSLFDYRGKPRLVLQTCSGAWFQNRQLFYFEFVGAE